MERTNVTSLVSGFSHVENISVSSSKTNILKMVLFLVSFCKVIFLRVNTKK